MWNNAAKAWNRRAWYPHDAGWSPPCNGLPAILPAPTSNWLQTVSSSAGKGFTRANGSRHSPASSLWLGSAGPTPGSLPSGEETQRAKCLLPCSWLTHRHGPQENAGMAGTGPGGSGCPGSSNMAEEDGSQHPSWTVYTQNAFGRKGRSAVLEAQKEEKREKERWDATWSAPLASGSSRGGVGGEREGRNSPTGRRLTPQVET